MATVDPADLLNVDEFEAIAKQRLPAPSYAYVASGSGAELTLRWNRAAERLFGWAESEVLGKVGPYVPPELQAESARLAGQLLRGEPLENVEARRQRKDGATLVVSISGAPVRDANGAVVALMLMMSDVSERQRAARREQLEFAVTRVLAESQAPADAIRGVLKAMGELGGWAYGAHWQPDPADGLLSCSDVWHVDETRVAAFAEASRGRRSDPTRPGGIVRRRPPHLYAGHDQVRRDDEERDAPHPPPRAEQPPRSQERHARPLALGRPSSGRLRTGS